MDTELYLIRIYSTLNLIYHKVKYSREDIEKTHSHRRDLIDSMLRTEADLSEVVEAFKFFDKKTVALNTRNYQLEKMIQELIIENRALKRVNEDLMNGVI